MAIRVKRQASFAFTRADGARLRQWKQRMTKKKVTPALGRPRLRKDGDITHDSRPELRACTSVHVTLSVGRHVPNLRSRKRFAEIRRAFAGASSLSENGFRLVHFAVLGNHLHLAVEVDSKRALSAGMKKIAHSISRRLSAQNVLALGGDMSPLAGPYSTRDGWLGRVFAERYHARVLKTKTEIQRVLVYLFDNAKKHFGWQASANAAGAQPVLQLRAIGWRSTADPFSSFVDDGAEVITSPRGKLLKLLCANVTN